MSAPSSGISWQQSLTVKSMQAKEVFDPHSKQEESENEVDSEIESSQSVEDGHENLL